MVRPCANGATVIRRDSHEGVVGVVAALAGFGGWAAGGVEAATDETSEEQAAVDIARSTAEQNMRMGEGTTVPRRG
jgi:hypothetical protein